MSIETLDGSSFPIYKGTCSVDDQGIHIHAELKINQTQIIVRILARLAMMLYFLYLGVYYFGLVPGWMTILHFLIVLGNLLLFIYNFNSTNQSVIVWEVVKEIKYKKGILPFNRPFIIIKFLNEKNKIRKRNLVLLSSIKDGNNTLIQAQKIISFYQH